MISLILASLLSTPAHALTCPSTEIVFDGACRDITWFRSNLAATSGGLVYAVGVSDDTLHPGAGGVLLVESDGTPAGFDYLFVSDVPAGPSSLLLPRRGGYPTWAAWTTDLGTLGGTLTHVESTRIPTIGPSSPDWVWTPVTVWEGTFMPGGFVKECIDDACVIERPNGEQPWSCHTEKIHIENAVDASCMAGVQFGAAHSGVLANPTTFTVLFPIATATSITSLEDICLKSYVEDIREDYIDARCDSDAPPPVVDFTVPELQGCMVCNEFANLNVETLGPKNAEGKKPVLNETNETVCVDWEIDPGGSDSDGDGWCD